MATFYPATPGEPRVAARRLPIAAVVAAIAAVIGNLLVFALAKTALDMPLAIPMGGSGAPVEPLGATPVIIASALPALGAAFLLWGLDRYVARPMRIFQVIALLFLALSMLGPWTLPVEVATKVVLSVMHIVAGIAIVGTLVTMSRKQ